MRVLLIALLAAISYAQTEKQVARALSLPSGCGDALQKPEECGWVWWNWSVWRKLAMKCNGRPTYADKDGRFAYIATDDRGHWWGITSRSLHTKVAQERFRACSWELHFAQPADRNSNGLEDTIPGDWQHWSPKTKTWSKGLNPLVSWCLPEESNGCIDGDCASDNRDCGYGDCEFLKEIGECEKESDYMNACCKHVCDDQNVEERCQNHDQHCETWAEAGKCESNPFWMHNACPLACQICDPCRAVTCFDPPNECYVHVGTCLSGECKYLYVSSGIPCNSGLGSCDGKGICKEVWMTPIYRMINFVKIWVTRISLTLLCCFVVSSCFYGFWNTINAVKEVLIAFGKFLWLLKGLTSPLYHFAAKLRTVEEVPAFKIYGKCRCKKITIMKKVNATPWAIYRCHCSICREHGSEDGGIKWVGFDKSEIQFPNYHPEYFNQVGKRSFCPDCSVGVLMGYDDGYIYVDSKRLIDKSAFTNSKLKAMAKQYHETQCGTPFAHIHCKSDSLGEDYRFEPSADYIFEYPQDATWGHVRKHRQLLRRA